MFLHTFDPEVDLDEALACGDLELLDKWLEETTGLGVDLQGARLRPTSDATTVRVRDGEVLVTDGPFAETKEQIAGYDVVECASPEEALQWAAKHPTALRGSIDIRPLCEGAGPAVLPGQKPMTMRYLLLVCGDGVGQVLPAEVPAMMADTRAWVEEMDGRGTRLFGSQLEPGDKARTLRLRDGQVLVTDGPFAETKEWIGGFDVLECADLDEALEVAARHPVARFGLLEVRPFWPWREE